MIDQARAKDCYYKLHKLKLGQNDFINSIPMEHRNKYDFVVASGLINNHYLDEKIFQ